MMDRAHHLFFCPQLCPMVGVEQLTHSHTHTHTHAHIYIYIYTYIHTHTRIYIHTHAYTHIHIYTYTHTHIHHATHPARPPSSSATTSWAPPSRPRNGGAKATTTRGRRATTTTTTRAASVGGRGDRAPGGAGAVPSITSRSSSRARGSTTPRRLPPRPAAMLSRRLSLLWLPLGRAAGWPHKGLCWDRQQRHSRRPRPWLPLSSSLPSGAEREGREVAPKWPLLLWRRRRRRVWGLCTGGGGDGGGFMMGMEARAPGRQVFKS
jgi:hypothetical protein